MAYRKQPLPKFHGWILQCTGALLWVTVIVWLILFSGEVGAGAMVFLLIGVILGSMLLAIPEILRYQLALSAAPPPSYHLEQTLRDFHQAWQELSEHGKKLEHKLEQLEEQQEKYICHSRPSELKTEMEDYDILLAELRLELDSLMNKMEPIVGDPLESKQRELPTDLLGKAMKNSGKGKGYPIPPSS